jgi:hypothetical protein
MHVAPPYATRAATLRAARLADDTRAAQGGARAARAARAAAPSHT